MVTENNSKPNTLEYKPYFLAFLVVVFLGLNFWARTFLSAPKTEASDLTLENILNAVNKERGSRNLLTLNTNSILSTASESKALDMETRHYFSHIDPDGNYIWTKIVADGYTPYLQLGENLAIEFYDTDSLVSAWMNSPTHRANILNDGFRDQGMGLEFGNSQQGQYHSVVVNAFGTLLIKKAKAAPAPAVATQTPKKVALKSIVAPKPTPLPTAAAAPVPTSTHPISNIRGESVTLAQNNPAAQTNFITASGNPATTGAPSVKTVSTSITAQVNNYAAYFKTNRKVSLVFGFILLIFLIIDLKEILEKKLASLDKKVNNIFLLAMSILVIAFMYWL